ncbi:MAG: hypothetical protein V3V90_06360, partial [Thermodesulfobacteriota bacterium]
MKRHRLLIVSISLLLLTFTVKLPAHAEFMGVDKLTLSGYIKNATSINVDTAESMDEFLEIRSTAQLAVEYRLTENIHLFTIFREWYDSVYDAESKWRRRSGNYKKMRRTKGTDWLR